jgi:aminoglycoside/choline kinase family phosphotransferase
VLALYPPAIAEACRRFLASSSLLAAVGVPVPQVLAADCGHGRMLLEDLGPRTLYDLRHRPFHELEPYFERAVQLIGYIGGLSGAEVERLNPPLDQQLLERELEQTWRLFLGPRRLAGDARQSAALERALAELVAALAALSPVPCHRDLMARNLVPRPGGELVVLDHQDLRLGPPLYDLASLLNDSLFPPAEAAERLLAKGLATAGDRLTYHRVAAQRTLKAVGTYAAFAERGVERHLSLIAPTLGRALDHLAATPEAVSLASDLERLWAEVIC